MDNNMMKSFDKNNNFNKADMMQPKPDMIQPMPDNNNNFDKADMMQPEFDINQHEDEQTVHIRR